MPEKSSQAACALKTNRHTERGRGVSRSPPALPPCFALSVYQNTLHPPVSVPPQPDCVTIHKLTLFVVVPLPGASCRQTTVFVCVFDRVGENPEGSSKFIQTLPDSLAGRVTATTNGSQGLLT